MTIKEQVFAQAVVLAGQLEDRQMDMLDALCSASTVSLAARLREGLAPEDCRADFVAAASLFALSALNGMGDPDRMQQVKAGDLTVVTGSGDAASRCLRNQAELVIAPYLKDRFSFRGV